MLLQFVAGVCCMPSLSHLSHVLSLGGSNQSFAQQKSIIIIIYFTVSQRWQQQQQSVMSAIMYVKCIAMFPFYVAAHNMLLRLPTTTIKTATLIALTQTLRAVFVPKVMKLSLHAFLFNSLALFCHITASHRVVHV